MKAAAADRVTSRSWSIILLVILALAAVLPGALNLPVTDRDEARFAQATTQMLQSGDFIDIRFQDTARHKKPVGIHWLQSASVALTSDSEAREIFAYRLPSVLSLVGAVLATYALGCILLGHRAGLAGAALLAVSVLAASEAGIAKTDTTLLFATVLCFVALARLYEARIDRAAWLFWGAMGFGVLIKGPLTPLIVFSGMAALCLLDRRVRWLEPLIHVRAMLIGLAPAAIWLGLVQWHTDGAFLADAVSNDLGPKIVSGHESHGAPPGLHTLLMSFLFWPGTLLLIPGLALGLRALFGMVDTTEKAGLRFLVAMLGPAWLIFEIVPTKLVHYPLPVYPMLALLSGAAYVALLDRRIPLIAKGVATLIFAAVSGAYAFAAVLLLRLYGDPEQFVDISLDTISAMTMALPDGLRLFLLASLLVPLLIPLVFWRAPRLLFASLLLLGLGWHFGMRGHVAPSLDQLWVSERLSERLEELTLHPRLSLDADPVLVATGFIEPSLVFLTDTGIVLTNPIRAAEVAAEEVGRASLVEARELEMFNATMRRLGASTVEVGVVKGLNYSNGRPVAIHILRTTGTMRPASEVR